VCRERERERELASKSSKFEVVFFYQAVIAVYDVLKKFRKFAIKSDTQGKRRFLWLVYNQTINVIPVVGKMRSFEASGFKVLQVMNYCVTIFFFNISIVSRCSKKFNCFPSNCALLNRKSCLTIIF
jgi:hypothetical protein